MATSVTILHLKRLPFCKESECEMLLLYSDILCKLCLIYNLQSVILLITLDFLYGLYLPVFVGGIFIYFLETCLGSFSVFYTICKTLLYIR